MADLIDRQEAIDALDAIGHVATMPDGDKCIRVSAVKYVLSKLPSAQPESQWIPCSDGLPERCKHYIVTDFGSVEEAYYTSDGHWFSIDGNKLKDVTAWMQLPEPYQEERREDDQA